MKNIKNNKYFKTMVILDRKKEYGEADETRIQINPVGGYGNKIDVINKFEIANRFKPTERSLYTNLRVSWKLEKGGDRVSTGELTEKEARIYLGLDDRISTHNHPQQKNADGGSFSPDDITKFILQEDLEMRVVDYAYVYVMQKPNIGWEEWKILYPETFEFKMVNGVPDFTENALYKFFDKTFGSIINTLKFGAQKGTVKNDPKYWIEETLHLTNIKVSEKYRLPYARYFDNR